MKKNYVITIGRQLGSGGRLVADVLGKRFGIPVYDKELINEAAKTSGLNPALFEKADEQSPRLFTMDSSAGLAADTFAASLTSGYINNDMLFGMQSDTIRRLADQGPCIIVGRCADYVLRDRPDILTVFITAPVEDRVKRVAASLGMSDREARAFIALTEKKRAAYYNYYTFKAWGAADSYHLCLDSSLLGIEGSADSVACFAERLFE